MVQLTVSGTGLFSSSLTVTGALTLSSGIVTSSVSSAAASALLLQGNTILQLDAGADPFVLIVCFVFVCVAAVCCFFLLSSLHGRWCSGESGVMTVSPCVLVCLSCSCYVSCVFCAGVTTATGVIQIGSTSTFGKAFYVQRLAQTAAVDGTATYIQGQSTVNTNLGGDLLSIFVILTCLVLFFESLCVCLVF